MTPKSLLRHPQATSKLEELANGSWQPVLDDPRMAEKRDQVTRLVLCSGKVYYDLLAEAGKRDAGHVALVRLEQLYSFPWNEVREVLARYPNAPRSCSGCRKSRGTWAPGRMSRTSCVRCCRQVRH